MLGFFSQITETNTNKTNNDNILKIEHSQHDRDERNLSVIKERKKVLRNGATTARTLKYEVMRRE